METFSALLAFCAGNSPVPGEFPSQRPVSRSFDVFYDLCLNKQLNKQFRRWWFETPSRPLWRHCSGMLNIVWWTDMSSLLWQIGFVMVKVGCEHQRLLVIGEINLPYCRGNYMAYVANTCEYMERTDIRQKCVYVHMSMSTWGDFCNWSV